MQLARVAGTATSTVRHPTLEGNKLLVAQPLAADASAPDGDPVLVVDRLGAGAGDLIVITSDGAAVREIVGSDNSPLRYSVLGLSDQ